MTECHRRAWLPLRLCLVLLLGIAGGSALADQNDDRLPPLFEQLAAADDAAVARELEARIWAIWTESGMEEVDTLVSQGVAAMNRRSFGVALERFDAVVEQAPGYAEGWNKRATLYWLMDRLPESVADIRRTLALEPRHFGALSGMGLIFLESGDEEGALRAFQAVLAINPQALGTRERIQRLEERLRDRQI